MDLIGPEDGESLAAVRGEIERLHAFFEGWLSGRLPAGVATFAELEAALAPGFSMVAPSGQRLDRAAVIGWLSAAHGQRGADFRIWIENVTVLARRGAVLLASYDECQFITGRKTRRRATGVFERGTTRPVWLSVHETWVDA
jgi:hypothetical protein